MLKLADNLSLPLDAVTRRMAVLGMSGSGKSNVAVVLAEAMFDAGLPWVAIDPKGDWFGVRSDAKGNSAGLSIPIFGGLHGDIPLEPTAGKMVADLIVDERLTCVLDVSEFDTRQHLWGFLIDFGETLLHRNRAPLHLYLEEADEYLPQRTTEKGNLPKCLGVWQRVVKRGRFRGIGTTQITQRNSALNKDSLYMAEVMFAMRATGKGDREAIKGWVDHHNAASDIVASLPTLADGEGWVSSPAWLRKTVRVKFNRRRTFDSGATPVSLVGKTKPATLADIDLGKVREKMQATIERAKADDPRELKKQIAELQKQLRAALQPMLEAKPERVEVKVPVISKDDVEEIAKHAAYIDALGRDAIAAGKLISEQLSTIVDAISRFKPIIAEKPRIPSTVRIVSQPRSNPSTRLPTHSNGSGGHVTPAKQKILNGLAFLHGIGIEHADKTQLALLAGVSPTSGGYFNNLGALRSDGLINYPSGGTVALTDAGMAIADTENIPSSDRELHEAIRIKLPPAKWKIVEALIGVYPNAVRKDELAEKLGVSPTSGGYFNNLGSLRSLGLINYPEPGTAVASPLLFLE